MNDLHLAPETLDRRALLRALRALKKGDFTTRLPLDLTGIDGQIAEVFNDIVEINESIASEIARVCKTVGKEGQINQRLRVAGVVGAWASEMDSVNQLIGDLARPTAAVARVIESVADGDLSQRMLLEIDGLPLRGEFQRIAKAVNTMVIQLNGFASEVSRVAREVGTEGKLGGQARVPGVAGTWKDLTDNVNAMAANLTGQMRNIAEVTTAVAKGDLSKKITVDVRGETLELKSTINTMVDQLNGFASEVSRVAREASTEGKLGGQARVRGAAGIWKDLTDSVNAMAASLTGQMRNIAEVTTAVAKGDLSKKITVDVRGEILELKSTINTMVDQLNGFASEVSRVAREVSTEGKLGGQARVPGVAGTWKDLTDSVNAMAANLTGQMRNIAEVTTAVAKGDLSKKITVDVRGEILELKSTINTMVDQLNGFASEVSRVAREVGTEGKLGGQARVPGVAGTWKDLTDNVNAMAANLTTQVRAIAEVATAVTQGDLTRSVMVEAQGEVAALKDNINEMIRNLKDTTLKNNEQDWLKTNLAKFSRMLQGQGDLVAASQLVLSELAPLVHAQQGVLYAQSVQDGEPTLKLVASYAAGSEEQLPSVVRPGEGLVGQCALEKKRILLEDLRQDYLRIGSAVGSAAPLNVVILPVLFEGDVKAVMELASIRRFNATRLLFLDQLAESIGIVLNTIGANMRTRDLLAQSQSLTRELQKQQQELKQTNERLGYQAENLQKSETLLKMQQEELRHANDELQHKAELLSEQMRQVEYKNREIELAKAALEEKAEQLALSSRYKSEFLANMSHELRTPLNSLLILAKLLADNPDATLTPKQIDYAQTIYAAGADLLSLISDILDLAKIESGTVTLDFGPLRLTDLKDYVERTFRPTALEQKLDFSVSIDPGLPVTIETDEKRLQQVLKNLLSNAFKFTARGAVQLRIAPAESGWSPGRAQLATASEVIAFIVSDTGVGIPANKQKVIFEAFQQADGTTSRRFGGTGLGLSISRELTALLGGEIAVQSVPGAGSTFVLYLPLPKEPVVSPPPAAAIAADEIARALPEALPDIAPDALADALPDTVPTVEPPPAAAEVAGAVDRVSDDRDDIEPGDRVVLIVEDDAAFAGTVLDIAHERGFKAVIAPDGGAGLALAQALRPDTITLNLKLPDVDGWTVLERLKRTAHTRHIPVTLVSLADHTHDSVHLAAVAMVSREEAREALQEALLRARDLTGRDATALLVADGDEARRADVEWYLRREGVRVDSAALGAEALQAVRSAAYDCVLLGPELGDMGPIELLKRLVESQAITEMPFVIYGTEGLGGPEQEQLRRLAEVLLLKRGPTRKAMLDEITLFLKHTLGTHRAAGHERAAPPEIQQGLANRKVLIVDDDVRNVFALTGALEQCGMTVLNAESGKEGVEILKSEPDVELVLMDIMMPELDGYDTIRIIRGYPQFRTLPIIALTAKAMKGDREKCLEAGASDYIAKPVNVEQLTSLLRVWLNQ
ncbi:MAG: response regulator [Gammaproteobacteria bacterium]|nr:MAG: response regulator [Gammaproteobacteria bacterium]